MADTQIIACIDALRVVEDFLIAGKCPPGIRPIILEKLADILAYDDRPLIFRTKMTHRVDRGRMTIFYGPDYESALGYARRHGGKVKTNLRLQ